MVKALFCTVLLSALLCWSDAATSVRKSRPRFEDYPVSAIFHGRPKPVRVDSHPDARRFRTRLREGATAPPDFAGHYKVVMWGCGTECQREALVDLRTGRVYFVAQSELGVRHRVDSRLFVVNPPEEVREVRHSYQLYSYYYVWDEQRKKMRLLYTDAPKSER